MSRELVALAMELEREQASGREHQECFGAAGHANRAACRRPAKHTWDWIEKAVAAGVADRSVACLVVDLVAGFADPAARTRMC